MSVLILITFFRVAPQAKAQPSRAYQMLTLSSSSPVSQVFGNSFSTEDNSSRKLGNSWKLVKERKYLKWCLRSRNTEGRSPVLSASCSGPLSSSRGLSLMSCLPLMPWGSTPSHKVFQPLSYVRASSSFFFFFHVSEQKSSSVQESIKT